MKGNPARFVYLDRGTAATIDKIVCASQVTNTEVVRFAIDSTFNDKPYRIRELNRIIKKRGGKDD